MAPTDYKKGAPRKPSARKAPPPPRRWVWFGAGLCTGAVATAALFLVEPNPAVLMTVAPGAGSAGDDEQRSPRFEFYTLLPEKEIAIPDTEIAPPAPPPAATRPADSRRTADAAPAAAPAPAAPASGATRYLLQVGSFRSLEDADRLKARLAFLGLEPGIQTVSIDDAETWHRVRVGPFEGREAVAEARQRLKENGLEWLLIQLK